MPTIDTNAARSFGPLSALGNSRDILRLIADAPHGEVSRFIRCRYDPLYRLQADRPSLADDIDRDIELCRQLLDMGASAWEIADEFGLPPADVVGCSPAAMERTILEQRVAEAEGWMEKPSTNLLTGIQTPSAATIAFRRATGELKD